jgi:hypothetical protein
MKVGRGVEVFNLYEWLPGYGETAVKIQTKGTDLIVTVTYDCDTEVCERELRFSSVCSFYSQLFPGPPMREADEAESALLLDGGLVEYPDSEAAKAWTQHFGGGRVIRRYGVIFSAENILLVVMAGGVTLQGIG